MQVHHCSQKSFHKIKASQSPTKFLVASVANEITVTPVASLRNTIGLAPARVPALAFANRLLTRELNAASILLSLHEVPMIKNKSVSPNADPRKIKVTDS